MENHELFRISSDRKIIVKKPRILAQINTKEIQLRNDPKNFLHSGSKSYSVRQRYLISKKIKKNDVKGQIDLLSDLINNYSSSSIKNLFLIQKLKDENDFLIEELNRNIKKNTLFSKTTKETFHELVNLYEKRGYRIPNLSLENNLFKKSPLLIESKQDVDDFYKTDRNTQGNFIEDLDHFPEKNWNFLKKLKKEVDFTGDKNLTKIEQSSHHYVDYYSKKKAKKERKERDNLMKEIKIVKDLIKRQEKEKEESIENNNSPCTTIKPYNRDLLYNRNIKFTIKDLIKKELTKNKKKSMISLKIINNINAETEKDNLILQQMKKHRNIIGRNNKVSFTNNKTHKMDGKKLKTLITALNEQPNSEYEKKPKSTHHRILSYTEQMFHKINKKNLTDFNSYENDIIDYLKKKQYTIKDTNLDNFNKEMSERIYDIKHKIKKEGLSNAFIEHLGDYGENAYRKFQRILKLEKVIENMDKYYAKHVIDKYFDE